VIDGCQSVRGEHNIVGKAIEGVAWWSCGVCEGCNVRILCVRCATIELCSPREGRFSYYTGNRHHPLQGPEREKTRGLIINDWNLHSFQNGAYFVDIPIFSELFDFLNNMLGVSTD